MNCEKCNKEHDGSFGSGRFCSRSCACSRKFSEDTKQKISRSIVVNGGFKENFCIKCGKKLNRHRKNSMCVDCFNPTTVGKTRREWRLEKRQKTKLKFIEYKGGKCERCGYNKCQGSLEFHHKDGNKDGKVFSHLYCIKFERAIKELDKCELLCSNCHREQHWKHYSLLLNTPI
jgi:hypothetical protein